jgi:FKBP-type peptidyl-prolyl cis-trans isomerase
MIYLKKTVFLLGVVLIFISTACNKKFLDTDLERAARENEKEIVAFLQSRNLSGYTKTASGIHYNVTTENTTGESVELGEEVRLYYRLTLLNGSVVDTVLSGDPFSFGYYSGFVFDGFLESVSLLKEGEKGTFLIPASLAFRGQASQQAPAWSVLKADIEVLSFRDEEEQITTYITKKGFENVEVTQTGLRFIPTATVSGGSQLQDGDEVVLKYKGTLLTDVTFDEGEFTTKLGSGSVIQGFEEGLKKMKVGEKATIIFPSKIGYGGEGSGSIAPFSPLLFELEVLSKR